MTAWRRRKRELRAELGDEAAGNLIREATQARERSSDLAPAVLLVLRRPVGGGDDSPVTGP
jgi:hypothetical protein